MTNLAPKDNPAPTASNPNPTQYHGLTHLDPVPSYEESLTAPRPNTLQILGATWGGVTVTPDIQKLVGTSDRLVIDLRTIFKILQPDPALGTKKVLTVLYRFDDDDDDLAVRLLSAPEDANPSKITISRHASVQQDTHDSQDSQGKKKNDSKILHHPLPAPWRASPQAEVDILAVIYGPKRIEDPAVLSVLADHFAGRWGQVRMTNAFFRQDPWRGKRKSWTVYFRFVGSKRVQVVTGWEDGALEVPWRRDVDVDLIEVGEDLLA